MNELMRYLKLCVSEDEVFELMRDVKLSPEHKAKIGDEIVVLPDSHNCDSVIRLPDNDYGLTIKLISYFRFNAYLGHVSYGGGLHAYVGKFRTIWNDFNKIKPIISIRDINEELIEKWIRVQLDENFSAIVIMRKYHMLEDWLKSSSMLPHFLCLHNVMIYDCQSYMELQDKYNEEIFNNRIENEKNNVKYPLHLLLPILEKAMEYIKEYTNDIEILMANHRFLNDKKDVDRHVLNRRAWKFLKNTKYHFKEPTLIKLQTYCKKLKSDWKTITEPFGKADGKMPRAVMSEVVQQWQAANLIILGFFSAARSNEITRQLRNVKTPKTKYHEIDQGYSFTRIVWKTSRYGKLHTMPLPELGMQAYHNLSYYSEKVDGERTGTLQFTEWYTLNSSMHDDRMGYLLMKFSHWVHGKDELHLTPHQLRHAMASILNHLNDHNGLMIAAKLLGHESTNMTLTYEAQMKTIVLNQINHMANTSEDIATAIKEYEEEESLRVLKKKIMPDLNEGKVFVGPAKGIVQFTGSVVSDPKSFFEFHSNAIKDGQIIITQNPICICVRSTSNPDQMACQRGINFEDYRNVPIQPGACQGSSCSNSLFSEQNCEMLMSQTQSVKDLVPEDLREIASNWFFVVGDGLEMPNQKIIAEYEEEMKKKVDNGRKIN